MDLVSGDYRQSQVISRKLFLFDQIAFLGAEHDAETQLAICEVESNGNTCKMCFGAPSNISFLRNITWDLAGYRCTLFANVLCTDSSFQRRMDRVAFQQRVLEVGEPDG